MIDQRDIIHAIENAEILDRAGEPIAGWVRNLVASDTVKSALSGTWLGHQLHPMLTDLPIGAWTMAATLDLTGGTVSRRASRRLVGLGVLAALPAAASGSSDWSDSYGGEQRVGLIHAVANVTGTALQGLSWIARRRGRHTTGVALTLAGVAATTSAGYLGGYLSFVLGVGVNHAAFDEPPGEWTDVLGADELTEDRPVRAVAGDVPVVLVLHAGQVAALSATCVHAGGPLDEGDVVGDCVQCPWHASRFRLSDGRAVRGPAAVDQPKWQVRTRDGRVLVKAGV